MELYELRPKTLELYLKLKHQPTIGPENYIRGNGKTTALLILAKELLDTTLGGVLVAYYNPNWMRNEFRKLFPQAVSQPGFISAAPRGLRKGARLLVDEPALLKWSQREWDDIGRQAKVTSVGSWL